LDAQRGNLARLEEKRNATQAESGRWREAIADMAELRKNYFYHGQNALNELRLDLQKIFGRSGLRGSHIEYSYSALEKEKAQRVSIRFNLTASYPELKNFIQIVESHPKFMALEKIDFHRILADGRQIEVSVTLAGYYEV
jgi:Tfp pilus assembly protein PilO